MKEERPNEIAAGSDADVTNGSDNRPGYIELGDETSGHGSTIENRAEQSLPVRRASGPRTPEGKQRSRHNALKYGIFAKNILLKDESQSEFDSLLNGLLNDFRPEGTLEELLVEKLAALAWRHRRLFLAEGAEIRKNMEFFESDQRNRERDEEVKIARLSDPFINSGLIRNIQNSDVLKRCQDLLFELRRHVEKHGFNLEFDKRILETIYGDHRAQRLRKDLCDSYEIWQQASQTPEEERLREDYASPMERRRSFLKLIDEEIVLLRSDQQSRAAVQTARTQLEIVSRSVPDGPGLDRLLRYEASLERSFDRTLSQLERQQRMRLGQPVLPKFEVRHSLS